MNRENKDGRIHENIDYMELPTLSNCLIKFFQIYHKSELEKLRRNENIEILKVNYFELIGFLEEYKDHFSFTFNKVINTANKIVRNLCKKDDLNIIIEEMPYNVYLCHLDSKNIGQFISTNAMVKRVSEIKKEKNRH